MATDAQPSYYYASGQRVLLEPDRQHAAFDLKLGHPPSAKGGRMLNAHVWLIEIEAGASAPDLAQAQRLPVFKSGTTLVVALPEVRVEDDDPTHLQAVQRWLDDDRQRAAMLAQQAGRMTLQAGPALNHDGVALARAVVESCGVRSASPRLLRVSSKTAI